ncbi:hypothetical protein GCM10010912_66430 [Paenibacillus albidus]|uniref:Uncharacterized protein n=1 Tax=Paenibacillus albidus TaxID=2041023 RepID=A0A917D752_9BACL|nr:hypothetical protein GCM10010912_66430 [Paenibacillus albidus]
MVKADRRYSANKHRLYAVTGIPSALQPMETIMMPAARLGIGIPKLI